MDCLRWIVVWLVVGAATTATGVAQVPMDGDGIVLEVPSTEELIDEEPGIDCEPLDLRKATVEQIAALPGISLQDALSIVELLAANRRAGFETIEAIDGLTAEKLMVLRTYCRVAPLPKQTVRPARLSQRIRARSDLERRRGYDQPLYRVVGTTPDIDTIVVAMKYPGSPLSLASALDYDDGAISAHLLVAKDQGEPFLHADTLSYSYGAWERDSLGPAGRTGTARIGPFVGGGMLWRSDHMSVAVGDFAVGAGSGIALASRSEQRRSIVPRSNTTLLALDRSAAETSFLRGIAATYGLGRFEILGFYSSRSRDARIDSVDLDVNRVRAARSLRDGTIRRTHGDLRDHENLDETLTGARLCWTGPTAHAGATAYSARYSVPVVPPAPELWRGRTATVLAVDAGASIGSVELHTDVARSPGGTIAMTAGASARFERALLEIGLSEIPSGYSVPHGNGMNPFDRGSGRRIGIALHAAPASDLEIDLSLLSVSPSDAAAADERTTTCELAVDYDAGSDVTLRALLRRSNAIEIGPEQRNGRDRFLSIDVQDVACGLQADITLSEGSTRMRTGLLIRRKEISDGRLSFAEIAHSPSRALTLAGRFTLFDGDFPVYQFEQLLPGWPRSVSLNGRGSRCWIRVTGDIGRSARLSGFLSRTTYYDRRTISEGTPDEIDGDSTTMAGIQLDLHFEL